MEESLKGKFLIAAKDLLDTNFFRTVVLIVDHGDDGAMGFVINRPSTVTVAHALSGHFELPETDDLVYVGGPVEPSALFILHNADDLDDEEAAVLDGVYLGSSVKVFKEVVRRAADGDPEMQFRIYSGCAGWAPTQLEGEIERGDWYVLDSGCDLICHEDPYAVWELALKRFQAANRLLPQSVKNPEWN